MCHILCSIWPHSQRILTHHRRTVVSGTNVIFSVTGIINSSFGVMLYSIGSPYNIMSKGLQGVDHIQVVEDVWMHVLVYVFDLCIRSFFLF